MLKESSEINFSTTVTFKPAKVVDICLLQNTLKSVYGVSPWSYSIFLSELIRKSGSLYVKAYQNNIYVGFIGIRISGVEAHITNIAVLPKYQNKGIGYLLIEEGKKFSLLNNCLTIGLEVKESNVRAIYLYKQSNFSVTGIKKEYYKEEKENAIEMSCFLKG